jgi:hypothetical protein
MRPRRRPLAWLLAALVLLALAALVKSACGEAQEASSRPPPEFPRAMRPTESQRMTSREVLPQRPQAGRHRDPVLSALSAPDAGMAIVFEANALRHSPVGKLLLDCLASVDGGPSPLDEIRGMGVDPLQDVDRVALGDGTVVVSGDFARAQWDSVFGAGSVEAYGDGSQIRTFGPQPDGGPNPLVVATWGNHLVLLASTRDAAMASLDRIEGRAPTGQLLSDDQAYGDVYGVLGGTALGELLAPAGSALASQLQGAARSLELHLDATHDVQLVATVSGDDAAQLSDLGRALGGGLATARAKALLEGDTEAAELLEYAEVVRGQKKFDLEMAVPFEVLKSMLAFCGTRSAVDGGH